MSLVALLKGNGYMKSKAQKTEVTTATFSGKKEVINYTNVLRPRILELLVL